MLAGCETTPGCIAYIGVSYAAHGGRRTASATRRCSNGSGNYVLPTAGEHRQRGGELQEDPGERRDLARQLEDGEERLPDRELRVRDREHEAVEPTTAAAIKAFLAWGMDPRYGSSAKLLAPVYFQPLVAERRCRRDQPAEAGPVVSARCSRQLTTPIGVRIEIPARRSSLA